MCQIGAVILLCRFADMGVSVCMCANQVKRTGLLVSCVLSGMQGGKAELKPTLGVALALLELNQSYLKCSITRAQSALKRSLTAHSSHSHQHRQMGTSFSSKVLQHAAMSHR